jgi:hypothetical protein
MTDKTNEPAFPATFDYQTDYDGQKEWHYGMTLRDYFAAQVLPTVAYASFYNGTLGLDNEKVAKISYKLADAMLTARKDPNETHHPDRLASSPPLRER